VRRTLIYPYNGRKTQANSPHETRSWGDRCRLGHGPVGRNLGAPAPDQEHPSTGREIWPTLGVSRARKPQQVLSDLLSSNSTFRWKFPMGYRQRSRSNLDPGRLGKLLEASGPRSGPAKGQRGCPTQSSQAPRRGPIRGYEPPPPVGAGCLGGRQPPLAPFHGAPLPTPVEDGALRVRSRRPLAHVRGRAVRGRGIPPHIPTLGPSSRGTTGGVSPPAPRPSWGKPPGLDCQPPAGGGAQRPPHRGSAPRRVASARGGSRKGFIKWSPVTGDPGGLPPRATTVVGTTGGPRLRRGSGLSPFPLLGGVLSRR